MTSGPSQECLREQGRDAVDPGCQRKWYRPRGVPNVSTVPIGDLTGPVARA